MKDKIFDVVIVGGGPAGLTSALYCGRAKLSVLVIEKKDFGALVSSHKIENYPGVEKLTGKELYLKMKEQTLEYEVSYMEANFLGLSFDEEVKIVKTDIRNIKCKSVIIATGSKKTGIKKIEGEEFYLGKGVSYCATCDGAFTRNLEVSLVGKGEELLEEALYLTKYARNINIFITDDKVVENEDIYKILLENEKVRFYFNCNLMKIEGEEFVERILIEVDKEIKTVSTQFVFLYLGTKQTTEIYTEISSLDKNGYIITDELMKTNVDGIFAIGDVRSKPVRQVATAVSDGAIAGIEVTKYILKKKNKAQ